MTDPDTNRTASDGESRPPAKPRKSAVRKPRAAETADVETVRKESGQDESVPARRVSRTTRKDKVAETPAGEIPVAAELQNETSAPRPAEREVRNDEPRRERQQRPLRENGNRGGQRQFRPQSSDQGQNGMGIRTVRESYRRDGKRTFNNNEGQTGRGDYQNRQNGQGGKNKFRNNRNQNNRNQNGRDNNRDNNRSSWDGNQPAQNNYVPVGEPEELSGLLEITPKGYGFIRTPETDFAQSREAVYVPVEMIQSYQLRPCVWLKGKAQRYERGHQMVSIESVNGQTPEEAAKNPYFEDLKAVNPTHRLAFETVPERYTTRTLDLVAPVGRGQRGLIVAPPRTGKTTLLQHIAEAVQENYEEEMHLMILLVDERPEEVTEFKRGIPGAEVYASSNDSHVRDHCRLAELCIERAKRLVEAGKHVILLLDSITRLARAYNNADQGSGRTMSGGIDARALEMPRRLFAAARNTRTAGSLTILATALVETNSRMDDLIFQEFKGTGNMELVLNRRIAEQYIYPAVDILKSGTRREELILSELALEKTRLIRLALAGYKPVEAMERLLFFLKRYPSNAQMLLDLKSRA